MAFIRVDAVAVSTAETVGNKPSFAPATSADGRFVVFESDASNLVGGDGNGVRDIYLRDMLLGTTTLVSVGLDGTGANGRSFAASVSDDGRFVAFRSDAGNLTTAGAGTRGDVFVRDLTAGTTTRVSQTDNGFEGRDFGSATKISGNGRFVLFDSTGSAIVPGDSNDVADVFLRDLNTNAASLISVAQGGGQANGASRLGDISGNGRFVVFSSFANNLVAGTEGAQGEQVYLRDTVLGTTQFVSFDPSGAVVSDDARSSTVGGVSNDGRFVVFSAAGRSEANVYVRDTVLGTTELVSAAANGDGGGDDVSSAGDISADGRFVVFTSRATNLIAGEVNGGEVNRVYLRDLETGTIRVLSLTIEGSPGEGFAPRISADGRFVTFQGGLGGRPGEAVPSTSDIVRVSLFATDGDDFLIGTNSSETIEAGRGFDTIFGARGNDRILGGVGNDDLRGGNGDDRLYGENGNDTLRGDRGNDLLKGGAGADKLWGGVGLGRDTFVFSKLSDSTVASRGRDTIYDFGEGDRFDVSGIDADTQASGNQAFTFIGTAKFSGEAGELRYERKEYGTAVYADVTGDRRVDFAFNLEDSVKLEETDFLL